VSNVLNYPNPFTSYTRFVFTLTGSRLPDYFKIQIMSVSGTVVRELTEADLGPLHIGRNITQYGWDGTDQYGAPLANGVYFYRVVTNIDGEQVEHRDNAAVDRYFEKGFGKMVLIR
jgi:flagellar hook assembly protein FlgD